MLRIVDEVSFDSVHNGKMFSIWRPLCPSGCVSIGDVAHVATHLLHFAAIHKNVNGNFVLPLGYEPMTWFGEIALRITGALYHCGNQGRLKDTWFWDVWLCLVSRSRLLIAPSV